MIVDNNAEFRYTLACQLRTQEDFEVVGEAASGDEAVLQAEATAPDAIVLDVGLPEMNAASQIRALKRAAPAAAIIALSIAASGRYGEECRRAGGGAMLPKGCSTETIFAAIRSAGGG